MDKKPSYLSHKIKPLTVIFALATSLAFANLVRSETDSLASSQETESFAIQCSLSGLNKEKCLRIDSRETLDCVFDSFDSIRCKSSRNYRADCRYDSSGKFNCKKRPVDKGETEVNSEGSSQTADEFNIYCDYNGGETGSCFRLDNSEPLSCFYASQDFIRCKSGRGYKADCLYYGSSQFACEKRP